MKNKKEETHKMQHEDGVITGIVINGALPYCVKSKEEFLEGLKATNECEYGRNDIFVNYKGKENVFVEHYSLNNNKKNNKSKRGRIVFMQHGLDGAFTSEEIEKASNQYIEFEVMVKELKGKKAKNGFKFESLGIITKRKKSIKDIKKKNTFIIGKDENTYLFFNDANDKQKSEKIGIGKLIYEKTKDKNILIRTEFSTGQSSFENQLNEMAKIVSILGIIDDEIDVTFIGHSMGGIVSINYGTLYAKLNEKKDIDIITISTPYYDNFGAKIYPTTPARKDLANESTREQLKQKWDGRTKNVELCAIAVAKAGKANIKRSINLGDSVVNLKSQLGGDFNGISARYIVSSNEDEFKANFEEGIDNLKEKNYRDAIKNLGVDSLNDEDIYHHSNTPDLIDVIDIINDNIKN